MMLHRISSNQTVLLQMGWPFYGGLLSAQAGRIIRLIVINQVVKLKVEGE